MSEGELERAREAVVRLTLPRNWPIEPDGPINALIAAAKREGVREKLRELMAEPHYKGRTLVGLTYSETEVIVDKAWYKRLNALAEEGTP